MPTSPSSRAPTGTAEQQWMLNFRKIDAEEYYGDGHGARHAQRGSQETLPAGNRPACCR